MARRPESLSHDIVTGLYDDGAGHLWVATMGGLGRLDPASGGFVHFREKDGLPSNTVYGILPGEAGKLWISTNHGLSRFDLASGSFTNFETHDGLPSNEFNFGAHLRTAGGELLFGSVAGFVGFRPEDVRPSANLPPIVLTAFRKLDRIQRFDAALEDLGRIELSHEENFFAFEFAALDYNHPAKHRYAYKLEGFDADWIESGKRRYAGYTNLDGGTYTFRVQGSNGDGVWNEAGPAIEVVIHPPPWRTWWAYSLYVLTLAAALGGFVALQSRKVAPDLPVVPGDRARLSEAVRQLLANAVEHLGGQAAPRIEVGGESGEREATLYVRDNGKGIAPRYHERVFDLFERLEPDSSAGTGIGLALVRRIAEVHGGRAWVESAGEGHGSTFYLTLPTAVPER